MVYQLTSHFPRNQYRLADQMQRAAVSVLSNVAEGWRRSHKEWKNFMRIAFGSAGELESQLLLAKSLGYADEKALHPIFAELEHISKILNSCVHKKS